MNEAPRHIHWMNRKATDEEMSACTGDGPLPEGAVEYVRADLAKPRVKKLTWFECHGNIGVEMAHPPCGRGDSFMVGKSLGASGLYTLWVGRDHAGDYPSRDEAKAAAQACYESEILSALEDDDG